MNEQLEQVITQVSVETLERLAFVFAFPTDDDPAGPEADGWHASVSFSGPFAGKLIVEMGAADLNELAGNMLGVDEADALTPEQLRDALKETLNVLCGNILPAVAGRRSVFDIDAPRVEKDGKKPSIDEGLVEAAAVCLSMDEGICRLALYIDEPLPEGLVVPDSADQS